MVNPALADTLMAIPLPQKCLWHRFKLHICRLALKTFKAIPTHMMNICVKFH